MSSRPATVVVPTMSPARLAPLLRTLDLDGSGAELIIVDNRDPVAAGAESIEDSARIRVLRPGRNLGYSAAVNLAAQHAEGDSLVLLNDDCTVEEGFVEEITGVLDPTSGVTMAAGVMRQSRDPALIDSAGMELDRTLLVFDYLHGELVSSLDQGVPDPVGPSGAAAAFDRESFLRAGGFDENLFAYWEDVDLVLRLRELGGVCRLATGARGIHAHSQTLGSGSAEKNRLMGFGRSYVLRKWGVLRHPRLLGEALARDLVIVSGQCVVDRNLSGIAGRVAGLRTQPDASHDYPRELPVSTGYGGNLLRRWRRRRGLRHGNAGQGVLVVFHTALIGGPLRSLENELRWLATQTDVEVIVPEGEPIDPLFQNLNATVSALPYSVPALEGGISGAVSELRDQLRQFRMFSSLLRNKRPKAVLTVTTALPAFAAAARRQGVRNVLYAAELPVEDARRSGSLKHALRRGYRWFSSWLGATRADVVLACSPSVREALPANTQALIHYPAIDSRLSEGDGPRFRRQHGIEMSDQLVACVGSISSGRGQDLAIEAMPAVLEAFPKLRLLIVGEPFPRARDLEYSQGLDDLVRRLDLTGAVVRIPRVEPIGDLLRACDAIVNPAVTHPESFGRVVFEAGLAGVPSIVTRVGAIPDLHEDKDTVVLIEPGSPSAIADALIDLLGDPVQGAAMAARTADLASEIASPEASLAVFRQAMNSVGITFP